MLLNNLHLLLHLLIVALSYHHPTTTTTAYNIETRFPVVFSSSTREPGAHYGHSVLLKEYAGKLYRVIIGAPNSRRASLYQCQWQSGRTCRDVTVTGPQLGVSKLGMSLVERPRHLGQFLACAHLETLVYSYQNAAGRLESSYNPTGSCYLLEDDPPRYSHFMKPMNNNSEQTAEVIVNGRKQINYNFGHAMTGFSSTFTANGKQLFLGTPGLWNWQGGVVEMNAIEDRRSEVSMKQYKNNTKDGRDLYMGYTTVSGRFCGDGRLCLALGVPRDSLKGSVQFLAFDSGGNFLPNRSNELLGEQTGEYFGSSLLAVDINGDGHDDLLVGAPFYYSHRKGYSDEGRVAVFLSRSALLERKIVLTRSGYLYGNKVSDARFGTAMASLGDINNDGVEDVVIAAPYEDDGRGAIYIYHGAKDDLPLLVQKISALKHLAEYRLRGFGISLSSAGSDVDQNGVPDLLVGSYLSNSAVLLRSRSSLDLVASFQIDIDKVDFNQTCPHGSAGDSSPCFVLKYCFAYPWLSNALRLNATLRLDAEQLMARCFVRNGDKQIRFINQIHQLTVGQKEACSQRYIVYVRPLNKIDNLKDSIKLSLAYHQLDENLSEQLMFATPKINEARSNISTEIDFSLCSKDVDCASNIQIDSRVWIDGKVGGQFNKLVQGTYKTIGVVLNVTNLGDAAFGTHLNITADTILSFVSLDPKCSERVRENVTEIFCRLDSPLYDWNGVEFKLNPFNFGGSVSMSIHTMISNSLSENSRENLTIIFDSYKITSLDLEIDQQPVKSYNLTKEKKTSIEYFNTFKLIKFNESWIDKVQLDVIYPSRLAASNFVLTTPLRLSRVGNSHNEIKCTEPKTWLPNKTLSAESIVMKNDRSYLNVDCSDKYVCDTFSCTIGPMKAASIYLKYYSRLNLTAIESVGGDLEYEGVMFNIHLSALILDSQVVDAKQISKHVHYTFHEVAAAVEPANLFWPLFFGILIGLLILILVIWACYTLGFFNRIRAAPPATAEELSQLNQ